MSKSKNELVKLMLKLSNHNPYSGKLFLSKEDNLIAAIDLAKLFKEFDDNEQQDEAMNIDSNQWEEVISELEQLNQKQDE